SVLLTLLAAVMLPALGKARASARQLKVATELRAIGQAIDMAGASGTLLGAAGGAAPRGGGGFPETRLSRPQVVADDGGRASIDVDLADSITTWRVFGGAVTREGRLGSLEGQLAVFQPFFVDVNAPPNLTRGDEVSVPMVVYNYLGTQQTVRLSVKHDGW